MTKKLTKNAMLGGKKPELVDVVDGEEVRNARIVTLSHWEQIGTGEPLVVETILKNSKGEVVPLVAAKNLLDKYTNATVNARGEEVDKGAIHTFVRQGDGSIGDETMPYPTTEIIQEVEELDPNNTDTGQAIRIPSNQMEDFLIHEQYEIVAADIKNDAKVFGEAEKMSKTDEVLMFTFSNGSYTLRMLRKAYNS